MRPEPFVADLATQPRIPARDDAEEFSKYRRPRRFLDLLVPYGVDVRGARVADLGTGFGSIAIECARSGAREVIAFDANLERLATVDERAGAAGVHVETREINLLTPLEERVEADVAFLIGVVEYAGLWDETKEPSDLQRRVFQTAFSVLRPGGVLVFGSKNRIWPRFIVDDVHTHLPLVNALPRSAADALSRRLRGTPYRHHIHGPRKWESMLRETGFREVRGYRPYFSYQLPILIPDRPALRLVRAIRSLPLSDEEARAARGPRWLPKAVLMGLAGDLGLPISHSVLMLARK
jgi:SAM-dependent methyltransferase